MTTEATGRRGVIGDTGCGTDRTRCVRLEDAAALAELLRANRTFLERTTPALTGTELTEAGQRTELESAVRELAEGRGAARVVIDGDRVIGRARLSHVVRGPFQSASLGYLLAEAETGRGHAAAAVAELREVAFVELSLHRVEAQTIVGNTASQRVLERNGFERVGMLPGFIFIAGAWTDAVSFQRLAPGGQTSSTPVALARRMRVR